MKTTIPNNHRSAFTLLEVLVVISIIGALVGITIGASMRIKASQAAKVTEANITKLASALDQQMKATVDMVNGRDFTLPSALLSIAGDDSARARSLAAKMYVRTEFPQTFAEANTPVNLGGYVLSTKPAYTVAINGLTGLNAQQESAVLLFLALKQARRGMSFNPDEAIGASFIRQIGSASYFVDSWDQPIGFVRWSSDANVLAELAGLDYSPNANARDKLDPEGRFQSNNPAWNSTAAISVLGNFFGNQNYGPFIYSSGPNKVSEGVTGDDILSFRVRKSGQRGG